MKRDFSTQVTGSAFLTAGLLLWLGWMLLPTRIGTFFRVGDFSAVGENLRFWIWMYRIHFFGIVVSVMALVALGALLADAEARILIWPGVGVAAAGLLKWKILPTWLGMLPAGVGIGAMVVTMGFPDDLHFYLPIFHVWAFWLAATGIVTLRSGVRVAS